MLRRTVGALGVLGLVWALALPAVSADVLFKTDFNSGDLTSIFKDVGGVYMQGFGGLQRNNATVLPFLVRDGVLTSSPAGSTDGSDGVADGGDENSLRFLLLFGLDRWPADVAMQYKLRIDNQNTGGAAIVVRARPKTKASDPDSWYEFRYTTGNSPAPKDEETDSSIPRPATNPNLRIMKVLNGKWTILAESPASQTADIPAVNAAGADNATGAIFRIVVKGDTLTGYLSKDEGKTFTQALQAKDSDLKTGRVGISHYDYNPLFDDLLVETAP